MQEPKQDKDEEWCRRINEVMNNPPSVNSLSANRNGGNSSSDGNDLSYMLNNMSQQQLLQLFGGVGQMGGLSNILGSIKWAKLIPYQIITKKHHHLHMDIKLPFISMQPFIR